MWIKNWHKTDTQHCINCLRHSWSSPLPTSLSASQPENHWQGIETSHGTELNTQPWHTQQTHPCYIQPFTHHCGGRHWALLTYCKHVHTVWFILLQWHTIYSQVVFSGFLFMKTNTWDVSPNEITGLFAKFVIGKLKWQK